LGPFLAHKVPDGHLPEAAVSSPPVESAAALYRLAGLVVHSGRLDGGHYVAYVRYGEPQTFVRPATGEVLEPPCGSLWAYCSDSHVEQATVEAALAADAYILFYERVACSAAAAASSTGTSTL
jgi:ubiquitin C-terminal hydrolase